MLYDLLAYGVALVALALIVAPAVPTGIVGSIGVALVGISAVVSTDEAAGDVLGLQHIVIVLLAAFALLALHVGLRIWRMHQPLSQHRRRDDWHGSTQQKGSS